MGNAERELFSGVCDYLLSPDHHQPLCELRSAEGLRHVLTSVFQASLQPYEGAFLSFSVAIDKDCQSDVALTTPQPVSTAAIRDYASAAQPDGILIVSDETAPVICGLADGRSDWDKNAGWRTRYHRWKIFDRQWPLQVDVLGPGRLKIRASGTVIRWEGGVLKKTRAFEEIPCVASMFCVAGVDKLMDLAETGGTTTENRQDQLIAIEKIESLNRIVNKMRQMQHGGCILVTDDTDNWSAKVKRSTRARFGGLTDAIRLRARSLSDFSVFDGPQDFDQFYRAYTSWEKATDILTRLTHRDGAVVLDPELNLLGFGVVFPIEDVSDIRTTEIHWPAAMKGSYDSIRRATTLNCNIEDKGTRHRSAIAACDSIRRSIAIVVSQDASISIVSSMCRRLRLYTGCSVGFDITQVETDDLRVRNI